MRRFFPLIALALIAVPGNALAAPLKPFGHSCKAQNGVRFCETKNDAQRVPSFDGLPIDVDVTLPPTGSGPFPTIVLMHGYGGSKTSFESTTPTGSAPATYHYNNIFFAQQGYAVVTPSARGFGRSCGVSDSRTSPECDRGWIHFADQRFELRDTQYLLGLLADEGIVDPARIGMSGISYGGLQTAQFAFLRNRVRLRNGSFVPWKSPNGKPLHVAAAWMRWASGDLAYSLVPNGRFLSTGSSIPSSPYGVEKQSLLNILYVGGVVYGFVAPQGADPTADLAHWRDVVNAGEPYKAEAKAILAQFRKYKGIGGLSGPATPLLLQNGWTDPVFPAQDAVRLYNRARASNSNAPVVLQLGDIGHFTGGEALADYVRFNTDGAAFLAHYLKGAPGGPASGSATVFGQGCPKGTAGFGPVRARSYWGLARGSFHLGAALVHKITSTGGDQNTSNAIEPYSHPDRCALLPVDSAGGRVLLTRTSPGFTQIGLPAIHATVATTGQFGQIDARLWDVANGHQRLVDWGVYRLTPKQHGDIVFQLFGNAYRFRKGHRVKLELVGDSGPLLRPSNVNFDVTLSKIRATIPTRERPTGSAGISKQTSLR